MKRKHKKLLISSVAVTAAGVIAAEALLQTSISVQASAVMMPGIEEIIQDASEAERPFRILEIVDEKKEAEIGYYVSGQEPFLRLYEYTAENGKVMTFSSVEEGLAIIQDFENPENSSKRREEFVRNIKLSDDGMDTDADTGIRKLTQDLLGEDGPLSYEEYKEKYFLTDEDAPEEWTKISLLNSAGKSRTDRVKVKGSYVETPDMTGDYTKQLEVYYPLRKGQQIEDTYRVFKENINNFLYVEGADAEAPYFLEFAPVKNSAINESLSKTGEDVIQTEYDTSKNRYGLYENVYTDLTDEIVNGIIKDENSDNNEEEAGYLFPGEQPTKPESARLLFKNEDSTAVGTFSADETGFSSPDGDLGENDAEESVLPETEQELTVPQNVEPVISDGEFSSGAVEEDVFSEDTFTSDQMDFQSDQNMQPQIELQEQEQIQTQEQVQTQELTQTQDFTEDQGQQENTDIFSEQNKSTEKKVLGDIKDLATQGSSSNPYIYIAEPLEEFPYYKYKLVGDLEYVIEKQKECAQEDQQIISNNNEVVRQEGDITLNTAGMYLFWQKDAVSEKIVSMPLDIVTGRQYVEQKDVKQLPTDYEDDYYYRVSEAYFCCSSTTQENEKDSPENYAFDGWYYADYQAGHQYLEVDKENPEATYYTLENQYNLTPERGDYDFVPDDEGPLCTVEVNQVYYKGGYSNKDWLKRYVFNLLPEDMETAEQFENFQIQVDTLLAKDFDIKYGAADQPEVTSAGFTDAETTVFSDSAEAESVFSDTADGEESKGMSAEGVENTDAQEEEVFSDDDTSEVSVPVSYAQEILGIETAQEIAFTEDVEDMADTAAFTSGEINTSDDLDEGLQSDEEDGFTDAEFTSGEDVPSAETRAAADTETEEDIALTDYDLIYVNGQISAAAAQAIVDNRIPVIINQRILGLQETDKGVAQAFASYLLPDDADQHYVSQFVYVFCLNKDAGTNAVDNSLLNLDFYKSFDRAVDADDGFREITDYIAQENEYRKLGSTSETVAASQFSDEEASEAAFSDSADTSSAAKTAVPPLTMEISQARAIEYIINYKYKRSVQKKGEFNVLEIRPGNTGNLSQDMVEHWLVDEPPVFSKAVASSWDKVNSANKAINGNIDDFWDAAWGVNNAEFYDENENITTDPWIKLEISGNPELIKGIRCYSRMKDGSPFKYIEEYKVEILDEAGEVLFEQPKADETAKMDKSERINDIIFEFKMPSNAKYIKLTALNAAHNDNGYKKVSIAELQIISNINITSMSSAEYVGHIDDINTKYDMIYIAGPSKPSGWGYILGNDAYIYTHVGGMVTVDNTNKKLMGQLDTDWTSNKDFNTTGASFRGSGNDITKQQYTELMDFVKSGYPVVIDDSLLSSGKVDTSKVDNSSYIYDFLKEALGYDNVMSKQKVTEPGSRFKFYVNLGKPEIVFSEGNGRPAEVIRSGSTISGGTGFTDEDGRTVGTYDYISGELRYKFKIKNTSEISPANIRYDCRLYLDLNFDGNLASDEEQAKYMEIRNSAGKVQPRVAISEGEFRYELKSGEEYTLIRKIPNNYFKVIAWRLEVSEVGNPSIRTSQTGYSKQLRQGNPVEIKVLHIAPTKTTADAGSANTNKPYGTWNLQAQMNNPNSKLRQYMNQVSDFALNIETITVAEFDKNPSKKIAGHQMLIIGFDDVYENMSPESATAILNFIKQGRSVIFAHDTTSYYNYTPNQILLKYSNGNDKTVYSQWLMTKERLDWGVSLNSILRNIVGMDRYGITSTSQLTSEQTVGEFLKQGKDLTDGSDVNFETLMKLAGDIAYKVDSNKQKSTNHVQGYANSQLQGGGGDLIKKATKVNDGVITQYPYQMGDTITIADTHEQYYQLALEQDCDINGKSDGKNDIVVWYCLQPRDTSKNENKNLRAVKNDVRNNYYFYSKGNVIYTGAGHSDIKDDDEIKLFINAMIAAANVSAVKPEVTFVESLNPAAKQESVRYYATDQMGWTNGEGNLLEKDIPLYINVTDYNMVSASVGSDQKKEVMTAEFYIEDETSEDILDDDTAPDGMNGKKVLNIGTMIQELGEYGSDALISADAQGKFLLNGNNAYRLNLKGVEQYLRESDGNYKNDFRVYVKITSTVTLYGEDTTNSSWTSINLKQRPLFELD